MTDAIILSGTVHEIPEDLKETFLANSELLDNWNKLTALARNEWICWVTIVKKSETRKAHVLRLSEDILKGKKRPCCWPGCPHRDKSAK
jgi:uncharacterized protein YdeI (YjbR/CyaY-like superfamily)